MRVTLFGGSFNPPHLGHLIVIQQALELIPGIDELWLLPAFKHTFQKDLADASHRIAMTQTLMMQLSRPTQLRLKLETIECDRALSGETYETVKLLMVDHPKHTFSFLMGTDQLPNFDQWGNYQKLLQDVPFYLFPRAGYHNSVNYPNMALLTAPTQVVTNISSTVIRNRLAQDLPIDHLVPSAIISYIKQSKVYTPSQLG
jgi:nicotinate-nucleotide adenylyltransferase